MPTPVQQPWQAVERAFTGLNGAIAAGALSHNDYQASLLDIAKEIPHFEGRVPDRQGQARILAAVLEVHQDALRFWAASIQFYSRRGNDLSYGGGLPMKMVGLEWMIDKYNLPTQKSDIWGINLGVERSAGLRAIWSVAKQRSDEAFEYLRKQVGE